MNFFDLIPGNDPVSKIINGTTIAVGMAMVPAIGIPAAVAIGVMTVTYCIWTGRAMWTYKA